ncbi:hypothetical protein ACBY01_07120 [Sphingomonas sp. ac-8]|uniref:hypothetical protein n=1 Tax=Sphingomonas sp. ac-8 TaxID=3242977 RepID=UPI003A7F9B67
MVTTIHDIPEASPAELAALPAETLMRLQAEADAHAKAAARITSTLHSALVARYATARAFTGTYHREDGTVAISVTVPKKVKWDQAKLDQAIATIRGWGENPADYVDTEVKVAERKYDAWPPSIRAVFEPARTVETGKPVIKMAPVEQEAA